MAEEIDRGSSDRQATWVAVKTLRQRPTVVGRTDDGATIYEIRSVRLVLTPGANHFKRLVACAKCGREVPGSSIISPLDLDRSANSVFCDRCAQSSGPPRTLVGRTREDAPAPAPAPAPPAAPAQPAEVPAPSPVPAPAPGTDDDAVARQRLSEQVAALLRGQNAELAKVSASVAQVRAELGELARVQRDHSQRMAELAARVEQRRVDESAARSEMDQIAEVNRELAGLQGELDEKVRELAARPGPDPEAVGARELAEVRERLAAMIDTERMESRAALAEGLDLLRAEIAGLERRIGEESTAFTARLEMQRAELTQALHAVARETLMPVAESLRDLTRAGEDFERRLESLQQKAEEGERQMEALTTSADARDSRQQALEQLLESTAEQLARLIEVQTQPAPAPAGRPVPGGIMESLERQLRAAELRLMRTTSDAGGD